MRQLYNDIVAARDYSAGLNGQLHSMAAHRVEAHAGLEVVRNGTAQQWQCSTSVARCTLAKSETESEYRETGAADREVLYSRW